MTVDRSASPRTLPGWRWDVALSFAGAQRDYVEQVAAALKTQGVRCFYDADEQIELWGKYLAEELPAIYGEQAATVVVFVSAEYAARNWTQHERRAALARAVRERREYVLPARFDDTPLPGLLRDMSYVDLRTKTSQQFAAMIVGKLAALGITGPRSLGAGDPAWGAEAAGPPGAVRAGEADSRWLGVHGAISVPGVPDEIPPEYVLRDADAAEHGVRARVAAAAERGGFVLLVGGSSVGKTRCAVEAVRELLPDWWLVYPDGPGAVASLAEAPVPRTVVWLDELQRYLDGEQGLTGAAVRALLTARHPAVLIGTMWPDWYTTYAALPTHDGADPHAREREVLDLAVVVRIGPEFTAAEHDRARAAATRDRRLAVALEAAGYGLTQNLAAAPQLVGRWQDARTASPYGWAVLTAALDLARLGARAPLSADLLRAAAPGYCTSQQQAEAPDDWFEQALSYATVKLHGAVAALSPAGADMSRVVGYIVADYLVQHASGERRSARVPASTWDAALSDVRDPADSARLADSATNRMLYRYAIPLYRHAVNAGDGLAASSLAFLLAKRGDLDEADKILRPRAAAGDWMAAVQLASLLAGPGGDLEGMMVDALLPDRGDRDGTAQTARARADTSDDLAACRLADQLAARGDLDGAEQILRARGDAGSEWVARRLAGLLAERGDIDGLRERANAGDNFAARSLADLLADRGDLDGAVQVLRVWADDDGEAARRLADLLAARGDIDELRERAKVGYGWAARRLAGLLAARGDIDELRERADLGEAEAAVQLAGLLAARGDIDELRERADLRDRWAAEELARLLADRDDLDGLRARVDAGDGHPAWRLADLLADLMTKQGRGEEAERLRRFGLNPDGSIAYT